MFNKKKLIDTNDSLYVAGHRGMVGSSIIRSLRKRGYTNIITCDKKNLDLKILSDVDDFFKKNKPNVVVLSAAKVGGIYANSNYPADFILDNLLIQMNIIQCLLKYNVRRFLFLGSSCIYPKFAKQPIKEEYLLEGGLEPSNEYYAIAKISGLKLCEALYKQYGLDSICLMPTNLYGTCDNYDLKTSHVLPALVRKFCEAKNNNLESVICWGDGSPRREFLHCDDLADACIYSLENINVSKINDFKNPQSRFVSHINVGTGIDISIKDLAEIIANLVNFKGDIIWDKEKLNGTPQKKLDISLMSKLGWNYKIPFKEGILKTIDEFQKLELN